MLLEPRWLVPIVGTNVTGSYSRNQCDWSLLYEPMWLVVWTNVTGPHSACRYSNWIAQSSIKITKSTIRINGKLFLLLKTSVKGNKTGAVNFLFDCTLNMDAMQVLRFLCTNNNHERQLTMDDITNRELHSRYRFGRNTINTNKVP